MTIHCRGKECETTVEVEATIEGFSATDRGIEPDGHFTPPPHPWRAYPTGGYVCSDKCMAGEPDANETGAR